ncbi:hypothetical protein H257_11460 [Aphanomyces astaci]|uniref:Crinkler effector protein N-terminal domain-containing protein n=1 Tax=Aphanomyces astaci TaxID=112090 RepID=W4G227_APHAT|nr:hypothetical protein H257_11460 [Aphanomyces astaci]ETV73767.1 hypothetical protein H257_11460 [Aphanomyces astaci]|eukprot:XP_009836703.1 hypothetical protein H257_11460 [Aphanomyces astaci]
MAAMTMLWCAVYGEKTMFPVTILLEDAYVSDLQKAIITEMKDVDVLPAKVKLYLARKQGEWLRGGYDLEAFLQSGVSSEYPKMLPLWKLTMPELFGSNFEPAVNVIHVLVALPSEPPSKKAKVDSSGVGLGGSIVGTNHAQPPQATWKPDVPPAFCLLNDDMFFVDRDDAVKQLQEIHRHTYIRASSLGDQYVQRCRDAWKDLDKPTDFHKTLMRCHTVRLVFKSGALVESSFDAVLIHLLVRQLRDMFEVPPAILSTPPPSVVDFLELLTDEVGPLFIALDEIGAAFTCDSWTDLKSRDRLMAFCRAIVGNWLLIPNMLLVLLGRGPFLGLVGKIPTQVKIQASPFTIFCRLRLRLLRQGPIKTIMAKTFVDLDGTATIKGAYGLEDDQVEAVAQHLFQQTCGHPRSLLMAFTTCQSYAELMAYHACTSRD